MVAKRSKVPVQILVVHTQRPGSNPALGHLNGIHYMKPETVSLLLNNKKVVSCVLMAA